MKCLFIQFLLITFTFLFWTFEISWHMHLQIASVNTNWEWHSETLNLIYFLYKFDFCLIILLFLVLPCYFQSSWQICLRIPIYRKKQEKFWYLWTRYISSIAISYPTSTHYYSWHMRLQIVSSDKKNSK